MNNFLLSIGAKMFDFLNEYKSVILIIMTFLIIYRVFTNFMGIRYFGRTKFLSNNSRTSKFRIRSRK